MTEITPNKIVLDLIRVQKRQIQKLRDEADALEAKNTQFIQEMILKGNITPRDLGEV